MKKLLIVTMSVLLVFGSYSLFAQEEDAPGEKRDEIRARIEELKKDLMSIKLGFDDATLSKIFEINEKYAVKMGDYAKERGDKMKALEDALKVEEVKDSDVKVIIDDLFKIEENLFSQRKKEHDELSKVLSTEELGRLILFNIKFNRNIMRLIREVGDAGPHKPREESPPPPPGGD